MSAETLIQWRKRLGFTQGNMAEYIGIPRKTYGRWERGDQPSPIARVLISKVREIEMLRAKQ